MNAQATLKSPIAFDGVGLHTGVACAVEVRPSGIDSGLSFVLSGNVRVAAVAENVVATSLATAIGTGEASVSTVEHLLSALFGMGVSNAEIHVSGPEIPVADGSGKTFADAIVTVGLLDQRAARAALRLVEPLYLRAGDRALVALPADRFRVRFLADFAAPIGAQYFDGEISPALYRDDICAARTFAYLRDVEGMRARGLAQGGSLDNALVFDEDGPMRPMRWPNEVVRHKVLDLLGDFALLGAWPFLDVLAIKSGHQLHCEATRALRDRNVSIARGA
ncbi:MAG TPA: UDP-3-O-acyl-N-acetylglucosamine deacetylase [Candidatus Baltobacteraceae bacterium]